MDYNHSLRSKTAEPSAMSVPPRLLRGIGIFAITTYLVSSCWHFYIRPSYLPSAMSWTSWSARLSSVALNPKASCTTTSADKTSSRQLRWIIISLPQVQLDSSKTSLIRKEQREVFWVFCLLFYGKDVSLQCASKETRHLFALFLRRTTTSIEERADSCTMEFAQ